MKTKFQVSSFKFQVANRTPPAGKARNLQPATCNLGFGFTLIELLVVISIMGLLAALTVPALKSLGKSNIQTSASRQLLDDIGRARQLAISQHTTVYMVFVPTNFFSTPFLNGLNNLLPAADSLAALRTMSNVLDKQLSGYNFVSLGKVGDQPGQHAWHYLANWKSLPEGTFIAAAKFLPQDYAAPMQIPIWQQQDYAGQIDNWRNPRLQVYGFATNALPFPTALSPLVMMPNLAFDSRGRLISEFDGINYHHAYIPLAQGSVGYGMNVNKQPLPTVVQPNDITETPRGNSTSISYNVIDVEPLTGRSKLLLHHIP